MQKSICLSRETFFCNSVRKYDFQNEFKNYTIFEHVLTTQY